MMLSFSMPITRWFNDDTDYDFGMTPEAWEEFTATYSVPVVIRNLYSRGIFTHYLSGPDEDIWDLSYRDRKTRIILVRRGDAYSVLRGDRVGDPTIIARADSGGKAASLFKRWVYHFGVKRDLPRLSS